MQAMVGHIRGKARTLGCFIGSSSPNRANAIVRTRRPSSCGGESRLSEFLSALSDSDFSAFKAELNKQALRYFEDAVKLEEFKQTILAQE